MKSELEKKYVPYFSSSYSIVLNLDKCPKLIDL